ncbi:hypothetical protein PHYBLDRAFT_188731 [Phycomyces blakesleeanus NRRL 1555(-)]|uniref:Complex 1 LYR protein n=1 Tax=Phycomyces blakesleeanus (strain ATCC 8743b / DSM 1359 / FGSC 10004 / NBRC 33097 / NRRL 1555) TaxID=763407 RepID=A0A167KLZ3_PHYB8|nr:hypothetical protein PHYBLDRAFT_188731 [Phycomyces blakesleeanus NRRL 1555(-)]OAD68399.1 hypothetical protein PHYBLDRAFT_188731 [Phycomyces blakesleeanus NRRL 1555(-)]|eukprot:XP_018286439.1 hypothetical protein PHYBLDRAFT_188731 [Phycomyces blakesleeanus NRRL 1555(-)]
MSQVLNSYRHLLREVNIQYTKGANNDTFAKELKSIFRQNKDVTDPKKVSALVQNADNVLIFLKSSRQHKILRDQYAAIVLEQKKRIEMSAHRVGLELPKPYDPNSPLPGSNPEAAVADRVAKAFGN